MEYVIKEVLTTHDGDGEDIAVGSGDCLMSFKTFDDDDAVYIFDKYCKALTPEGYQEYEAGFEGFDAAMEIGGYKLVATRHNPQGGGYALWK